MRFALSAATGALSESFGERIGFVYFHRNKSAKYSVGPFGNFNVSMGWLPTRAVT
jgi:hypothetical protein